VGEGKKKGGGNKWKEEKKRSGLKEGHPRVRMHGARAWMAYFESDACASCARARKWGCAKGTTLARHRHNSLENVWNVELLNPRVRAMYACAWMVENA